MAVKNQTPKTGARGARGSRASDDSAGQAPPIPPLGTPGELITPEIKKYRAMLEENPASRVFATLGELYRKQGMHDEAIGLCLKGLKYHPDYLSGRVVLGLAYFDKGMVKEASEELERVVSAKPDHLMAAKVLGDVLLMNGDIERAKYYFERVLSLAPDDLDVRKKLEPMRTGRGPSAVPSRAETPLPPALSAEAPDEIIEGEGLEIVESDSPPNDMPQAQIVQEDNGPDEDGGIKLSADEITDILVRTEQQISEIEARREAAAKPEPPPPASRASLLRPATTGGVVPLYRAVERLQIGIVITDLDGTVHYANPAAAQGHGWDKEDLVGRHLKDFFPPGLFYPMTMHDILEKKSLTRDTMNVRKDGSVFPVRITYDVVEGDSREPVHIIIGMDDLTRHKEIDEDLWQLAIKDAETGLFNRRHFLFKIAEEIKRAERIGYPLCLMVFAISDFKSYRTEHGSKKAQRVLTELGKIARQSIRKEVDSAYRITEDEFAVILPTATNQKAVIVAGRLQEKVAKKLPDIEIRIGAASRDNHRSIEDLIDAAEKAAYRTPVASR